MLLQEMDESYQEEYACFEAYTAKDEKSNSSSACNI